MSDSTKQSVIFECLLEKPVCVEFDGLAQSSDGGLLLLKAADERLRLTSRLSNRMGDSRCAGRVRHTNHELLCQRVFGIAAGYEDGNDAAKMRFDPMLLMACGRDPLDEEGLASQATISRLENAVSAREAVEMGRELEDVAIDRLKKRCKGRKRIVIDLDPSVDPTHGAQQGSLFHGYYHSWCYLPMFGFLSFDGSPDHIPVTARLRPGNSGEQRGTILLVRRLVTKIRNRFGPRQSILVRLDAGFLSPRLLDELDSLKVYYVVGMQTNAVFKRWAASELPSVHKLVEASGRAERRFFDRQHKAQSWSKSRRIVMKAEVIPYPDRATKENPRFVVTNLKRVARKVYEVYCMRGDAENRIKEMKRDLAVDRTSCSRFVANQFRVVMTAAAFMLLVDMRWRLRRTSLGLAQVSRLVSSLVKVSVVVKASVRRFVLQLPEHFSFADEWRRAACALGASAG